MVSKSINMDISSAKNKEELVRMLAMLRLRSDMEASSKGITDHSVIGFSDDELEALPESLISHIIDDYLVMKNNGVKDEKIFKSLDVQRTLLGHKGVSSESKNLTHYIKQRIGTEFPQISSLEEKIIDMGILYTLYWFTKESRKQEDWKKADLFATKVINDIQQKHLKTQEPAEARPTQETAVKNEKHPESEPPAVETKKPHSLTAWLVIIAVVCATAYWLFFMGGSELINWTALLS